MNIIGIAHEVRAGNASAVEVVRVALSGLETRGRALNAVSDTFADSALEKAEQIDREVASGKNPGPLAGVPYGVKDLFDVAGLPTTAGSILSGFKPASEDAVLIRRLERSGAILCARQRMDEFAYGFTTENAHFGSTQNPVDETRVAGGSSGGSAACVAAGILPFSLGSDTNGSIRVPASLCGVFGLKPTFGRLPRSGTFPFVASLDHVGPFASSVGDLAAVYDALQGADRDDPVCWAEGVEPVSHEANRDHGGLRIARLGGYFASSQTPEVRRAVDEVADALEIEERALLNGAEAARSAAFVITAAEGGRLHLDALRGHYDEYDPAVRDRLLAGACLPSSWYLQAQRYRESFKKESARLFEKFDVLIAPATPCTAPRIGQKEMELDGRRVPVRPNLGLFTQPISFIGLPVLTVPVAGQESLPAGVQLIAPPRCESSLFRLAFHLERLGVAQASSLKSNNARP